jgi:hypothetical protein
MSSPTLRTKYSTATASSRHSIPYSEELGPYSQQSISGGLSTSRFSTGISETESISSLARAFYILIIITTIFFLVMLGTVIAVLVNFNNIVLYIAISSGFVFLLLLLLTVFIIGMKQFEKAYSMQRFY